MRIIANVTIYSLLAVLPAEAAQQTAPSRQSAVLDPSVSDFIDGAKAGTARYHDREVAVAAGYRLIGGDFPSMGEHWIHLGLLMSGKIDPGRPQVLSYAKIDGRPELIGVAYATLVERGESPPDFPIDGVAWHYHSGSVADESFGGAHVRRSSPAEGVQVAMIHAWIWLDNPAGVFAKDNWAIPFARLGLSVPADAPPAAAKSLSLLTGGDRYYSSVFRACQAGAENFAAIDEILERTRVAALAWTRRTADERPLSRADVAALAELWAAFETAVGCDM